MRPYSPAILALFALFGPYSHGQDLVRCQSSRIYQPYTSCEAPAHGKENKLLRTKACGAESPKTCSWDFRLSTTHKFDHYVNEQRPTWPDAAIIRCGGIANNDAEVRAEIASRLKNQFFHKYNYCDSDQEPCRGRLNRIYGSNILGQIKQSSINIDARDSDSAGYLWYGKANVHRVRCSIDATTTIRVTVIDDEICGVVYKQCRDKSHPLEDSFTNKVSPACPVQPDRILRADDPNVVQNANEGKITCATLDASPENDGTQRHEKWAALFANLELVKKTQDHPRVELQILLEIMRLNPSPDLEKRIRESVTAETSLEGMIDYYAGRRSIKTLKMLAQLFPEEAKQIAQQNRSKYASLDDLKYIVLFPEGVSLQKAELTKAINGLDLLEPAQTFRVLENIVRSTLTETKNLHLRSSKLLELRVASPRDMQALDSLISKVVGVRGLSAADGRALLEEWQGLLHDRKRLSSAIRNFLDSQIKGLEREAQKKSEDLWKLVERARGGDPRLHLLHGYRALAEADASGFKRSLESTISRLKENKSYEEAVFSIGLLQKSAQSGLASLKELQRLLDDETSKEKIIAIISGSIQRREITDNKLIEIVNDALEGLNDEQGSSIAFKANLKSAISTVYEDFMTALDDIPRIPL